MVRCADCGLLCYKHPEANTFEHLDAEARKSGAFPAHRVSGGDFPFISSREPYCFSVAVDLPAEREIARKEAQAATKETDSRKIILIVIDKDRDCPSFIKWRPGYSPKEHRDMLHAKELKEAEERGREQERIRRLEEKWADRKWAVTTQIINTLLSAFLAFVLAALAYWLGIKR